MRLGITSDNKDYSDDKVYYICRWLNRSFRPFSKRNEQEYRMVREAYEKNKMGKRITYTADVAHCGGEECALRDQCVRYKLFRMWEKRPYKFAPFIEYPAYDSKTNQCEMYKPIEL